MSNKIYRFRPIENLLEKHKELENQSIFFAPPESLNDPMEGFQDIYWSGDSIIWKNFFRHYLLCLDRACSLRLISNGKPPSSRESIPVFIGKEDLLTPQYKKLFEEISSAFFRDKQASNLLEAILQRSTPIRRDELSFYLRSIHTLALDSIYNTYEKHKLIAQRKGNIGSEHVKSIVDIAFIENLERELTHGTYNGEAEKMFSKLKNQQSQTSLMYRYNGIMDDDESKNLLAIDFPDEYISRIEKLVFPEWYTACFMSECTNSSIWGSYANNHTGACLIFNTEEENECSYLRLTCKSGMNANSKPSYGLTRFNFFSIDYTEGFGEIDFFRMLGRLPIPKLNSTWYSLDGKMSSCADDMATSEDKWRKEYWDRFYRSITKKTEDWKFENEHRLILSGQSDYSSKEDRTLKYEFKSLKGIIFGIKTPIERKIEVIRIIEKKCKENNRNDFKFYQAHYCPTKGNITHTELSLIQLKKETETLA
ncbi:hypothetical protein ACJJIE_02685 [Microbulbifer sp. TRSA001]|uniref:hypothetical protein n=1 Tax=Microbulbifer sp. TRSA001 TaxID=3243381 RepID=UPI00403A3814